MAWKFGGSNPKIKMKRSCMSQTRTTSAPRASQASTVRAQQASEVGTMRALQMSQECTACSQDRHCMGIRHMLTIELVQMEGEVHFGI